MKKSWIITLIIILILVISILTFIIVDQYTKYALEVATIKLVKEYCDLEIEVKEVNIRRISSGFHGRNNRWVVETEPSNYRLIGYINEVYVPNRSGDCYREIDVPLKLNRLKREFVPLNK